MEMKILPGGEQFLSGLGRKGRGADRSACSADVNLKNQAAWRR